LKFQIFLNKNILFLFIILLHYFSKFFFFLKKKNKEIYSKNYFKYVIYIKHYILFKHFLKLLSIKKFQIFFVIFLKKKSLFIIIFIRVYILLKFYNKKILKT